MLQVPLAYKYVMTAAMIAFINHYAPRLNIPVDVPLKKQEIQRLRVAPPECNDRVTDYSGGILVSNYAFAFSDGFINSHWSHFTGYFTVTKLENDGMASFGVPPLESNEGGNSLMERASRMEYTITTNNVYRMATNYLVALEIDQEIFEKKTHSLLNKESFIRTEDRFPAH
jgi:hypothetical protein